MSHVIFKSGFEANLEAESRKFNRVLWILSDLVAVFQTHFDETSASIKNMMASPLASIIIISWSATYDRLNYSDFAKSHANCELFRGWGQTGTTRSSCSWIEIPLVKAHYRFFWPSSNFLRGIWLEGEAEGHHTISRVKEFDSEPFASKMFWFWLIQRYYCSEAEVRRVGAGLVVEACTYCFFGQVPKSKISSRLLASRWALDNLKFDWTHFFRHHFQNSNDLTWLAS